MRNYDKLYDQLEKDIVKVRSDCELIQDQLCIVRLEQRAIHYLMDSNVKNLTLARSTLINIFMAEFPKWDWNECIARLKIRKPEWW